MSLAPKTVTNRDKGVLHPVILDVNGMWNLNYIELVREFHEWILRMWLTRMTRSDIRLYGGEGLAHQDRREAARRNVCALFRYCC